MKSLGILPLLLLVAAVDIPALPGGGENDRNPAVELLRDRPGNSALTVALINDGQPTKVFFAGVRGDRNPVDEKTLFRACSLSKPVFAYLVLKLVEAGMLDLDRPLFASGGRSASELPGYGELVSDHRLERLTPRLLLTHRGGLPNWRWQRPDGRLAFESDPGSTFSYSGEGYLFLQTAVEHLCGKNLDDLCRQYVFGPLGMKDSRFLPDGESIKRLSFDLEMIPPPFREMVKRERNAAGSLLSTAGDYARFLEAVMNGRGLRQETAAAMLKPAVKMIRQALFGPGASKEWEPDNGLSWCLGWTFCRGPLGETYFHVGVEEQFENFAVFFPKKRSGLVVLASGDATAGLASDAVTLLFGKTGIPFAWMGYPEGRLKNKQF